MKNRLIIVADTKNEIDDLFAIAYALKSSHIDLLGVVSTHNIYRHGPDSVNIYHQEAQKILKLAGAKIPALKGASGPFNQNPEDSEGVRFVLSEIKNNRSKEKIKIVTSGPATDILNIIKIDPEIARRAQFYWFATHRFFHKILRPEKNFASDPLAATEILKHKIDLTIVPVVGTSYALVANTARMHRRLSESPSPLNNYLDDLLKENRKRIIAEISHYTYLRNYWIFCDLAGVAASSGVGVKKIKRGNPNIVEKINRREILQSFFRSIQR